MKRYEVTIQLYCGNFDVEVEFPDDVNPTDDQIHDAAVEEIEKDLSTSKLGYYRQIG